MADPAAKLTINLDYAWKMRPTPSNPVLACALEHACARCNRVVRSLKGFQAARLMTLLATLWPMMGFITVENLPPFSDFCKNGRRWFFASLASRREKKILIEMERFYEIS